MRIPFLLFFCIYIMHGCQATIYKIFETTDHENDIQVKITLEHQNEQYGSVMGSSIYLTKNCSPVYKKWLKSRAYILFGKRVGYLKPKETFFELFSFLKDSEQTEIKELIEQHYPHALGIDFGIFELNKKELIARDLLLHTEETNRADSIKKLIHAQRSKWYVTPISRTRLK